MAFKAESIIFFRVTKTALSSILPALYFQKRGMAAGVSGMTGGAFFIFSRPMFKRAMNYFVFDISEHSWDSPLWMTGTIVFKLSFIIIMTRKAQLNFVLN